ncbi:hypothetical protein AJ80_06169 [Polytolypa hystricis UAMH7299]|uniref:cellulase n=1 Tax=Polytolypa hystricis (strain UAMH7299) TaxID=1447883 RepID=A0A2B7XXZ4_POLH7|nr:hypothetical protein AJ80_06169 [Polytolypa hystricis UAMH7299]
MKLNALLVAATAGSLALASPARQSKGITKRQNKLQWFGVNESVAEFGQGSYPGEKDEHYRWPDLTTIQTLQGRGMNVFRVAFSMERLIPDNLNGEIAQEYFDDLKATIDGITNLGAQAILDPHNFGRYYDNIITSTQDFGAFWTKVATAFKDNQLVIFDTSHSPPTSALHNEYHDMDQQLVVNLNQAAIDAIRAAGATEQHIFVEGNSWSGAWTWTDVNDSMKQLTDPSDKIVFQMHQYLDADGSGTHEDCVSGTIGRERVTAATQWLKDNGKVGILGEFAGGNNDVCKQAVVGMVDYLVENSDVWLGALWWAAGPWWADYMFNMEPETGIAYQEYLPLLEQYGS